MLLLARFVLFLVIIGKAIGYECPMIDTDGSMPQSFRQVPPELQSGALYLTDLHRKSVPAKWIVKGADNGQNETLEGTIQEVFHHLKHPKVNLTHNDTMKPNLDNFYGFCYIHGPGGYGMASQGQVRYDANNYLRRINGDLHLPAGPSACSRVSCSWCAGIWVCNDNSHEIFIPAGRVADGALGVADECYETHKRTHEVNDVMGQIFSGGQYNVIVSGADC